MRTFKLSTLAAVMLLAGAAMTDARMGGGSSHGGGPIGGGHGSGNGGGHARPAQTTYHYGAQDFSAADAAPAPVSQAPAARAPQVSSAFAGMVFDPSPPVFRREYSQRQWQRYWRSVFRPRHGWHHRYSRHRAMPLGSTAKIIHVSHLDRRATPLKRVAMAAPKEAAHSRRRSQFIAISR